MDVFTGDVGMTAEEYNKKTEEELRQCMSRCDWRRDAEGAGVCALYVLPCEKVLGNGNCEAAMEYFHTPMMKGQ